MFFLFYGTAVFFWRIPPACPAKAGRQAEHNISRASGGGKRAAARCRALPRWSGLIGGKRAAARCRALPVGRA